MSPGEPHRPLRALTVSPSAVGGGAEKVALQLHEEYLARGVESWLALGCLNAGVPQALQIPNDDRRGPWAKRLLRPARSLESRSLRPRDVAGLLSRGLRAMAEPRRYARVARGHEDFDFPETPHLLELPPHVPDVVHFHNLHGSYFDVRALPQLSAMGPTLLTLHDAWLLTGHCAYPLDCERWRTGCGDCPDLSLYVPLRADASADNWGVKREAVKRSRLAIATPSRWLQHMVENSGLVHDGADVRCIPNGVDTRVFKPGNKLHAREALGLDASASVVLFAAKDLRSSQFKGFSTLSQAVALVAQAGLPRPIVFVALGEDAPTQCIGGVELVFPPFKAGQQEVARYYQAADLYVHPAIAENLPLAIIEAMACGTPVVASDVGGIPELVSPEETGLLFAPTDAEALANAVVSLLGDRKRADDMSALAVRGVRDHFTLDRQASAYLSWYQELIQARAREATP